MTSRKSISEYRNIPGPFNLKKMLADFLLLLISFLAAFFYKRQNLDFGPDYWKLLGIIAASWLLTGLLTGKFRENPTERRRRNRLEPFFTASLLFIGLITMWLYGFNWTSYSRMIIFGFFGLYFFLELLLLSGNYFPFFQSPRAGPPARFSYLLFGADLLIIGAGFYFLNYLKSGSIALQQSYQPVFALLMFLWFICGLLIHQFEIPREKNYLQIIYPHLKSSFVVLSIVSVIVFVLRTGFSRIMVFGSLALVSITEVLFVSLHYLYRRIRRIDRVPVSLFDAPLISQGGIVEEAVEKERYGSEKVRFEDKNYRSAFFREKLRKVYLCKLPRLFTLIDTSVDLTTVDILKSEFISDGRQAHLEGFADRSLEVLVNTHPLNQLGTINRYLSKVNRKLNNRGVYVGIFDPCERRKIYFVQKYPLLLANFLYFFDFLWHRVFPRLPGLKSIYFALTGGKRRVLSFAEALGRLYFHGFEILSMEDCDNHVYFAVKKVSGILAEHPPSYGFLFKQKRIGRGGKPIYIYKMRTMHPYSEFIHKYIYHKNRLDEKGKIKDDFRITSWGRFMRKFWLDELPMLLNWLKGEVALVGVRPLSETFYETYPKDLKRERIRTKPGLIPPYYTDMPGSIQEVFESERKYLERYFKKPVFTKIRYFIQAVYNIVIHRAKSG